jgi:hypothetical protein
MTETLPGAVHENMDTAYVNIASLLRYLQSRDFAGRVHIELVEYEADVYLNANSAPRVREINHATGHDAEGEEALQHLLARSGESGGLVSVYAGEEETLVGSNMPMSLSNVGIEFGLDSNADISPEEHAWHELIHLSGEVIAAVERASSSVNADFETLFRSARLELSDDYSFLDPLAESFEYARGGLVRLHVRPSPDAYVASICECMRRVVSSMAIGEFGGRLRERVALELAILARRRQSQLTSFKLIQQFDRIAGTRVL